MKQKTLFSRESLEAFRTVNRSRDRSLALDFVTEQGDYGATADEFADHVGRQLNQVSGRFSELKRDELIEHSGRQRPTRAGGNAGVYVVMK